MINWSTNLHPALSQRVLAPLSHECLRVVAFVVSWHDYVVFYNFRSFSRGQQSERMNESEGEERRALEERGVKKS